MNRRRSSCRPLPPSQSADTPPRLLRHCTMTEGGMLCAPRRKTSSSCCFLLSLSLTLSLPLVLSLSAASPPFATISRATAGVAAALQQRTATHNGSILRRCIRLEDVNSPSPSARRGFITMSPTSHPQGKSQAPLVIWPCDMLRLVEPRFAQTRSILSHASKQARSTDLDTLTSTDAQDCYM